ncbi:MAG: hypothetical protein JSW27_23820 [Phycisphaerales bacterium]|nr:MAG: hypothetical protein JSW27_23820 [Phycisphaerales bacterium]
MKRTRAIILLLLLASSTPFTYAMITIWRNDAPWNPVWPKELEPFRQQIEVRGVGHGIQETVFDVSFSDRAQFEKAWPVILKLKSPGVPLILEKAPSYHDVSGATMGPGVRVLWPSGGVSTIPGGKPLRASAPWPESIKSSSGQLPEYVVATKDTWVPFSEDGPTTFRHRARVDLVLAVDGEVVDLNRIRFPKDTPIIDRRFDER